ncbi:putative insertion sequence transposase protein [Burkholderia sp. YI23]|nr:putative insertion sequence transposase protein [Burkholderia sp. YI23]
MPSARHGTARRVVMEHFREERPALQALPAGVFNGAIRLERRVSHEGLVSVGGNYYSVPDRTHRRTLDVRCGLTDDLTAPWQARPMS